MQNYIRLIILMIAASMTAKAMANDAISEFYLNKTFWERAQWKNIELSTLWRLEGWSSFNGKQDSNKTFDKTRKFIINGSEFNANLAFENNKSNFMHFTSIHGNVTKKQCAEFAKLFTSKFGTPLTNDSSLLALKFSETNYMKLYSLDYQWDVGQTRINAGCFGTVTQDNENDDKSDYTWSMKYSHKSISKELTEKFALQCTRRLELTGSEQKSRDYDDLVFWVNPYINQITTLDLSPIGDDIEITGENIRFKIENKNATTNYSINRMTGGFNAEVYVQDVLGGRITGKCEKLLAPKAKF